MATLLLQPKRLYEALQKLDFLEDLELLPPWLEQEVIQVLQYFLLSIALILHFK